MELNLNTAAEQALSLIASANNNGDLSVKLTSLSQLKDLLSSSNNPALCSHISPFLTDLQSSPEPLVRKYLLQVIEEVGLRVLERSSELIPVLLALLKDEDPVVACQSIVSGMKFFSSVLDDLAWQYHRHGKVERWAEEMWMQMNEFKDAVISLLSEPVSVGTRLLAVKFLESFVLLFTPDAAVSDRLVSGGNRSGFNISCLGGGHPVLDASKLKSEANRFVATLLDMLKSSNSVSGPVTLAVVNCLAAIARKRADHYARILSALLDLQSNSETLRGCHAASLQYSVRTALLGFLRCTHPFIIESKDKLVRVLRSMNAADAVDQALRHADKIMRNNERSLREVRAVKEDQSSQVPFTGEPAKRKLMSLDNEEPHAGPEIAPKRMRLSSNGISSDTVQSNELANEMPGNRILSKPPIVNSLNHVEQMIAVIGAILAEGDRATESLELLITQIQPDLLADIVISNMKHLPKTPPTGKSGAFPVNGQCPPLTNAVQETTTDSTTIPAHSSLITVQVPVPSPSTVSTSLPDLSTSTNFPVESRRDPRRDPRRLDPRRASVEASLISPAEDSTNVQSRLEGPASANTLPSLPAILSTEHTGVQVQDADLDEKNTRPSVVSENEQKFPTEENIDRAREISSSAEADALADHAVSPALAIDERTAAEMSSDIVVSGARDSPHVLEFDYYSPSTSDVPASEESCVDLPEVPSYMYLTQQQKRSITKLAVEKIVRSYKELLDEDLCKTRMSILARLVSWMEADDFVMTMVQEDIVLGYRDQQGHELVMHILYHLYGLKITESSDQSPAAAMLYDKFLHGVAKGLLDALPASDKSFSRLLGEAPTLSDSVMRLLGNLCCPSVPDTRGQDIRDDRVTQGLGAVWSLILGRPQNRQACLTIALKCAVLSDDDTRAKAIRLVANKLYPLDYISETIEQYATDMLLTAAGSDASLVLSCDPSREVGGNEDPSIRGLHLCEPVSSVGNSVKGEHSASEIDVSMSVGEAQRLISLYFALCTKKPSLLQLVFRVYARSGKNVKQAIHRHIPILLRALGSSYSQLLPIISDPPSGSDNLLMLVLQVLAEQTSPAPDLINTVKHLYETKLKDATILIPILSSFSKTEVLPIFPRLVDLPLDKFQQALAHILQGTAHSGPALTPAEVLVAIHDIVPEKERIPLKKVMDACGACFEQRTVFTQHVLSKALNQMVDQSPLPLLFMRTVIQSIDAFPTLVDFVMEVLSKLVRRQIWTMPKLYPGFLKCVSQTQPHSFHVLLQLPARQLEGALNKYTNLRGPLAAYSGQSNVKSSLPRSILAVLGLVHESNSIQPHTAPPLHRSDAGSVHGST